ncbi:MAG: hypothetical protein JO040_08665 [Gemmatimonadetes bacterium]|nr:hypothetical protein [Gemmatimonadota bacterium]
MRTPLLLALLLVPIALSAQTGRTTKSAPASAPPRQAASTWSATWDAQGGVAQTLVNRTFEVAFVPVRDSMVSVLFAQEVTARQSPRWEGTDGKVTVTAWGHRGATFERRLWSITVAGDRGEPWGSFYRVREPGCCATLSTWIYHDALTGRRAFAATSEPRMVNTDDREVLVSYLSAGGTVQSPEFGGKNAVGVLRTTTGGGTVLSRVLFRSDQEGMESMESPALVVAGWNEGNGGRLRVLVHFEDGTTATLPLVGGRLVLEGATLPKGIHAELLR